MPKMWKQNETRKVYEMIKKERDIWQSALAILRLNVNFSHIEISSLMYLRMLQYHISINVSHNFSMNIYTIKNNIKMWKGKEHFQKMVLARYW